MTVGFFLGIHASYTDESQRCADEFVRAINRALRAEGLREYADPEEPPDPYIGSKFGRSSLDHHNARCLVEVAETAPPSDSDLPQLDLIVSNPYRVAFLPFDFEHPLETSYSEPIGDDEPRIWVGSAPRLLAELRLIGPALGIHCTSDELPDELADKIDNWEPLFPDDSGDLAEDERTAWLLLFEGASLAVRHDVALCLAG